MMSFVPTFMQLEPQEWTIVEDEKPDEDEITVDSQKNFFIFIVDRSGSMDGEKMRMTN
jgi:uncharacterized protein with von Willebrand factor type A (vWA) domain